MPLVPGPGDDGLAQTVAEWTHVGGMLPKTNAEIGAMFDKRHSVVMLKGDEPVSHAGATFIYPDSGQIEVGSVVTSPDFLRRGAARIGTHALLDVLADRYPGQTRFAMANAKSLPLFTSMGGRIMAPRELDPAVFENCGTCPVKKLPRNGDIFCCDTPVDLTNVRR